jgi:uncharacterized protein (DUF427 family)
MELNNMSTSRGPAPGFINHPDHVVRISSADSRWLVRANNVVLADSLKAKVVEETGYGRVIYFPAEDVSTELLASTEDRTTCPFKGEARYFVQSGFSGGQPIAWTYPSVYDEVASLKDHIAFYTDRIELRQKFEKDS